MGLYIFDFTECAREFAKRAHHHHTLACAKLSHNTERTDQNQSDENKGHDSARALAHAVALRIESANIILTHTYALHRAPNVY